MRNRRITLPLMIFCFSTILYNTGLTQPNLKIELHEIFAIGSEESDDLYQLADMVTDHAGNIFVTDAMDYSLKKFDAQGKLVKRTGGKGKGPEEFLAPRSIGYFDQKLYVTDQFIPGLRIFRASDLSYAAHIHYPASILDFCVLSANEIAICAPGKNGVNGIMIIDTLGKVHHSVFYTQDGPSFFAGSANFTFDEERNIYVALHWADEIMKLDLRGNKIWARSMFDIDRVPTKKILDFQVPRHMVYKDIAFDTLGNVFVLSGHYSEHPSRDVFVFDTEGHHLATFTLPESSHFIHIDHMNCLYSRGSMGTVLKKYALHYQYSGE